MYQVSADYLTAIQRPLVEHVVRGYVGSVQFNDADIFEGTFEVTRQICDSSNIRFGGVYVGQLNVTFIPTSFYSIPRGSWIGKKITFEVGTLKGQNLGYEFVPGGVFTIAEVKHTLHGIEVVAYDDMTKFDRRYNGRKFGGSLSKVIDDLCDYLGVDFNFTDSFCNFDHWGQVELDPENDFDTWRDYLSALLESRACYSFIDRDGKFVYRSCEDWLAARAGQYGGEIFVINPDLRFDNIEVSDYTTNFYGASYTRTATGEVVILGGQSELYSFYDFGSNPFLQDSYGFQRFEMIYSNLIQLLDVIPYSCSTNSEIALDFGDFLRLPDGIGKNIKVPIMAFDYVYKHSVTYQAFGSDPAKSSSSSASSGGGAGGGSAVTNKIAFYYGESQSSFDIETEDRQIVNTIEFVADQDCEANSWTEIKGTISKDDPNTPVTVRVIYLYDDNQVSYSPEFTFDENGYQTLSLNYFMDYVDSSISHTWDVALEVSGGSFQIADKEVHTLVWGQGLSKVEGWGGRIRISDELALYLLKYQPELLAALTDSAQVDLYTFDNPTASDVMGSYPYEPNKFGLTADFVIISVGEPDINNIFFCDEAYSGDSISTGLI